MNYYKLYSAEGIKCIKTAEQINNLAEACSYFGCAIYLLLLIIMKQRQIK